MTQIRSQRLTNNMYTYIYQRRTMTFIIELFLTLFMARNDLDMMQWYTHSGHTVTMSIAALIEKRPKITPRISDYKKSVLQLGNQTVATLSAPRPNKFINHRPLLHLLIPCLGAMRHSKKTTIIMRIVSYLPRTKHHLHNPRQLHMFM